MGIKNNILPVAAICVFLLAGCSGSPLVRYPAFPEKKNELKSISLMEEFLILDAMSTDTSLVNLIENKKLARTCLDYYASTMQGKGYALNNSLITSVGLLAERDRKYKVIESPPDEELPDREIPEGFPPFYLHDSFRQDTLHEQLLRVIYRRIVGYEKPEDDSSRYLRTSTFLGKLFGSDCFAFLFVGGYNVHASQQYGQLRDPQTTPYEKVSYGSITQVTMLFYIVDARTGEIIWDDHISMRGGLIYKEKLLKMAKKILERLP